MRKVTRVGHLIRQGLDKKGLAQGVFCQSIGVCDTWLSNRIRGVQTLEVSDAITISDKLEIPVSDLITAGLDDEIDANPVTY